MRCARRTCAWSREALRHLSRCACLIALSATIAWAQGKPVKILISSRTEPATAAKDAPAIAAVIPELLLSEVMKKYPCAEPQTMAGIKDLAVYDYTREMLDANYEGGLEDIAGAMGASYLVSITVTPFGSGQYRLSASVMNAANASSVAKPGRTIGGGNAATQGMNAFVQQVVQGMSGIPGISKGCGGVWTGTIVYRKTSETSENVDGAIRIKKEYEATLTLGAAGSGSAEAKVRSSLTMSNEQSSSSRINCAKRPGFEDPVWKTARSESSEHTTASVEGATDAQAGVTVTGTEVRIALTVPAVDGGTMVVKKRQSGSGCDGAVAEDIPDMTGPWASDQASGEVTVKLDPANPDKLAGSREIEPGTIIQWALSRSVR